jgi:ATP-dependent Clp protease ATP-binding subunit ClpC
MFDRYSDRAKRVIYFARLEASHFGIPQIDTNLLLLGILREDPELLPSLFYLGVNEKIRNCIRQENPTKKKISTSEDLPFSEISQQVLKNSAEEADQLGSHTITHKHILIGLLRDERTLASRILKEAGLSYEDVRKQLN